MKERKFTIQEWGQRTRPDQPISESELRKQLIVFTDECYLESEGFDKIIDILLYGKENENL